MKWENGLRYGVACFQKVTITAGELVIRPSKSDPVGVGNIASDINCDSDLVETCNAPTGVKGFLTFFLQKWAKAGPRVVCFAFEEKKKVA